ncbi:MAG: carbonic anhydrase [Planctomycetaceae bacterium]
MQRLLDGIQQFQQNVFGEQQELFERLAQGQRPSALFITCSDSRIVPNLLTQTTPGELFVLRTVGNVVPPHDAVCVGEAATIEYAVRVLNVQDVIVCGHSLCGAMAALLDPQQVRDLPAVQSWLKHVEPVRHALQNHNGRNQDRNALWAAAIEQNVLVQLENLKTHPAVAAALERDAVRLHGWVYQIETGQVFAYDPERSAFGELQLG